MESGRSVKQTLWAVVLTLALFFVATGFARSHAMESEAMGAILLWFVAGAIAIWIGIGTSKAFPRVSQGWTAFLVTVILGFLLYRSSQVVGFGFAFLSYGSGLLPAVIGCWRAIPREMATEPEQPA